MSPFLASIPPAEQLEIAEDAVFGLEKEVEARCFAHPVEKLPSHKAVAHDSDKTCDVRMKRDGVVNYIIAMLI